MNEKILSDTIKVNNRNELLHLLPKKLIVAEIGVFEGEYSEQIENITNPSKLFLVDIFSGIMISGDKDGNNIKSINLNESYNNLLKKYKNSDIVEVIKNDSKDFLNELPDNYLDVVYIDGDHSFNGVKKDLELSRIKVKNNGYILGHDYSPNFKSVMDAVNEFCSNYNLNISVLTEDGCPSFLIKNNK